MNQVALGLFYLLPLSFLSSFSPSVMWCKKSLTVVRVVLWVTLRFFEDILVVGTYNQKQHLIHL